MLTKPSNQTVSRSAWAIPFAICCLLFLLFLIAATIILSLIPIYLARKTVNMNNVVFPINGRFASDLLNGRTRTLSNTNGVGIQILRNIPNSNGLQFQTGQFLPATASAKKKRQTSNANITCERATGLTGDIFSIQFNFQIPVMCDSSYCQQQQLNNIQNSIRMNYQRITVVMTFTSGETLNVQLTFCSFGAADSSCTSEISTFIYLLDQDSHFFRFHPVTYNVTFIGTLNCSTTTYPYSMAVQRNGTAWTVFTDGSLYTFDIQTAICQATTYVSGQEGLILFGMDFATDGLNNNIETLYISSDSSNPPYRLGSIDVNTLELSIIGYYDTISARAELTVTNDGKLFGLFEGTPFIIAEIDQRNAQILSKIPQNMIRYISDSSYFAFTSYSSNFFLFVGNYSSSDFYRFNSSSNITTKEKTILNGIVSAGKSTCARLF